jgi:dolichol-phosphate mannosyltransferase
VRGINLSRNFGQHATITAGLDKTRGKWIVVLDCDPQDRPEEISKLCAKTVEGLSEHGASSGSAMRRRRRADQSRPR